MRRRINGLLVMLIANSVLAFCWWGPSQMETWFGTRAGQLTQSLAGPLVFADVVFVFAYWLFSSRRGRRDQS
jgi:GH35 family endo-1,4-beta-xylanase